MFAGPVSLAQLEPKLLYVPTRCFNALAPIALLDNFARRGDIPSHRGLSTSMILSQFWELTPFLANHNIKKYCIPENTIFPNTED